DHSTGEKKFGTVGAVALDAQGHLAAATSTGGMTNKRWQRIGDSPVVGAGTYANDATCAISCTGNGEAFLRAVAAHDVHALMAYKGLSLQEAVRIVVQEKLPPMNGEGGMIAVDREGLIVLDFNCTGMYRANIGADGVLSSAIFR
ncbi:MAG: isoaspartyl peptidase/L-asparaginase, partial [Flavobacteriales bacterium]